MFIDVLQIGVLVGLGANSICGVVHLNKNLLRQGNPLVVHMPGNA